MSAIKTSAYDFSCGLDIVLINIQTTIEYARAIMQVCDIPEEVLFVIENAIEECIDISKRYANYPDKPPRLWHEEQDFTLEAEIDPKTGEVEEFSFVEDMEFIIMFQGDLGYYFKEYSKGPAFSEKHIFCTPPSILI